MVKFSNGSTRVEKIHKRDFLALQNTTITYFSLISNKIKNLPNRVFYHLNSVQSLRLDYNLLTSFDIQPFLGMASIKELSVFGCRIHRLIPLGNASYDFDNYPFISILDMRCNSIENVPADSYWGFTKLQALFLTHNKIKTFGNQSFCKLQSLTELDISYNKIAFLTPHTFACLSSLTKLNVSGNSIQTISPQSFNGMPSITSIFLSRNKITNLNNNKRLWTLTTLRMLDLSFNDIKSIFPRRMNGLSNLTELRLSFNPVSYYDPIAFKDLRSLQRLYLSNQKILVLQNTFQQLHTVLFLCISNTRIKISGYSIDQFVNMTHLYELRMEKAQLTGSHLYDVVNNQSLFTGLHALKRLRLKDNYLHSLDSRVFYNLSKLYYLDMTNSNIHVLRSGVFYPLSSLAVLRLSGNKLAEIAGDTFHGLSHLSFLNLQNNGLRGLEVTTFAQNPKLKTLLLPGNQISIIKPETVFPSNISLHLDVSRNPFACTCSLIWFRQWLHSANIDLKHADQTLCSGTSLKEFVNKPILSFHPEDHCGVNVVLIVVLSFLGVLVGVMAMLVYNKRWWLNHKIFLLKLAIVGYIEMEEDFNAGNYRHHLNLMFHETEEEWVNQVMKPALEERLPHLQNIIYGDEDLHLGMYYINALYDAIDNSFKTVLLLSNQSVNNAWTMTKLRMALEHINDTGLDKVILIFVEDIEDDNLPYLVRLFLSRNRPYMLWTEDEDRQELFWAQFEKSTRANRAINNAIPL
ncbi:insulin-like growth factor-binding protein complex acid labile subunit [Strongylocentrotus purpuratus]|uniref:TIR domain-containing protein n=1 Tax=Strongylocentrotus purpuratus TaxID=7668 RepID=A0A7M7LTI2_STRPU|nr:insulin-like growth factor-binding protein complex acid labile subunit [Strongylocentrotus purpuratus]